MKKTYSKSGNICRVTFELPPDVDAEKVSVCGEFNDWDPEVNPLKLRKDGRFSTTLSLQSGREYRFRYLIDGKSWENDWEADQYVPNEFGTEDSVVVV